MATLRNPGWANSRAGRVTTGVEAARVAILNGSAVAARRLLEETGKSAGADRRARLADNLERYRGRGLACMPLDPS